MHDFSVLSYSFSVVIIKGGSLNVVTLIVLLCSVDLESQVADLSLDRKTILFSDVHSYNGSQ